MNLDLPKDLPPILMAFAKVVLASYRAGVPVVIYDEDGGLLHGQETLDFVGETDVPLTVRKLTNVDCQDFEGTDMAVFCEAARLAWLRDEFSKC